MTRRSDPWFKFHPSDWRAEPSLRAVSMAARGLWIEMLCLMHEAEPRGHLLLNGRPVTDAQLAALAGVPLDMAQALLGELESAGTFSRTRAGVIYSRRMRSDTAVSAKQRANVEKRWSKGDRQPPDNAPKNRSRITKHDTEAIPKKPEAREDRMLTHPVRWEASADFRAFWEAATDKMRTRSFSREKLYPIWLKLSKRVGPQSLLSALRRYVAQDADVLAGRAQPGLHRWLQDGRFEAWAPKAVDTTGWPDDRWAVAIHRHEQTGEWPDGIGPPPGQPGCRVPRHLLLGAA